MASNGLRVGLQILLGILIIGLSYVLYLSITEPYAEVERQQELTAMTRARMDQIRQVAIHYESQNDRFPLSLDTLVMYAKADSAFLADIDSLLRMTAFNADSLLVSPRTGKNFLYSANDTSRVKTYLLQDPDSDDQIGTLDGVLTLVNAANWE